MQADDRTKAKDSKTGNTNKLKPLGEVTTNVSPAMSPKPVPSKKASVSKGTPGAGKLLRKHHASSPTPPLAMPVGSKSAGKLVAIAELTGDA